VLTSENLGAFDISVVKIPKNPSPKEIEGNGIRFSDQNSNIFLFLSPLKFWPFKANL